MSKSNNDGHMLFPKMNVTVELSSDEHIYFCVKQNIDGSGKCDFWINPATINGQINADVVAKLLCDLATNNPIIDNLLKGVVMRRINSWRIN